MIPRTSLMPLTAGKRARITAALVMRS